RCRTCGIRATIRRSAWRSPTSPADTATSSASPTTSAASRISGQTVTDLVAHFDAPYWYRTNNGVPNQITMNATPFLQLAHLDADMGVYAQDRWTIRRATVSYGLRYDHFASSFPEQRIGPVPLVPNRNFTLPPTEGISWHDIFTRWRAR